jgi:hypothetical protein
MSNRGLHLAGAILFKNQVRVEGGEKKSYGDADCEYAFGDRYFHCFFLPETSVSRA